MPRPLLGGQARLRVPRLRVPEGVTLTLTLTLTPTLTLTLPLTLTLALALALSLSPEPNPSPNQSMLRVPEADVSCAVALSPLSASGVSALLTALLLEQKVG